MAKLSSDGKYVTVEKGDTLWDIARVHCGSGTKYQELASINGISNPDKIYVGQTIYLTKEAASGSGSGTGSGSGSGTGSTTVNSNKVTITGFGELANSDNTLFATWTWSKESQTASYALEWTYENGTKDNAGNPVWFIQSSSNSVDENNPAASRQAEFSVPTGTNQVKFRVKPVSKKETKNDKETVHFTGEWSDQRVWTDSTPLGTPSTPSVDIKDYTLTASLEGISLNGATSIEFEVYRKDGSSAIYTAEVPISGTSTVSHQWNVEAGGEYMVRCRAKNGSITGDWSGFSTAVKSPPAASAGITTIRATSKTSVYLEWSEATAADSYTIQYTTEKRYFDGSDGVSEKSGITETHYEFTGLGTGDEYFFRVRAVNEKGESGWSDIVSISIGDTPAAPTTWSSTTTAIVGEQVTLYWVHNSADGSIETKAELEITMNGSTEKHEIINPDAGNEDAGNNIRTYVINTSTFSVGTKITWRVRTAGVTGEFNNKEDENYGWSVERTIEVYAPVTLTLQLKNSNGNAISTMTSFPLYISALPGPKEQAPLSYHVSIVANESYETVDNIGNTKFVSKGEEVYSKFYDTNSELLLELLPSSVSFENGVSYTVSCTVSMNSGLNCTETKDFTVSWTEVLSSPNATITYDTAKYVTHIQPYCSDYVIKYYRVTKSGTSFSKTTTTLDYGTLDSIYTTTGEKVFIGKESGKTNTDYYCNVYVDQNGASITQVTHLVTKSSNTYTKTSTIIRNGVSIVRTSSGEEVHIGKTSSISELYYCTGEEGTKVGDVTLSVYRREYDGGFTEIATGIDNTRNTYVTDPHPALDYARYRIIATSNNTGAVSFYDVPGYPIGEVGVIIQWAETWSNFDATDYGQLKEPAWYGSLLRLPYNIDVSDSNNIDVVYVNYIGRKHPVSYYGTQLGVTSTWNVDIPAYDKETLYALRRLAVWMGDVYVREPSGSGYWANIKVSFSRTHCEVTIPVSLSITRVEGGA